VKIRAHRAKDQVNRFEMKLQNLAVLVLARRIAIVARLGLVNQTSNGVHMANGSLKLSGRASRQLAK